MARAGLFVKALTICVALALIAYAVSPWPIDAFFKLLALAFGVSVLTPLAYPLLRGVRKGDEVAVDFGGAQALPGLLSVFFRTGSGVAMERGRVGQKIMVALDDGSMRSCVVVSYPGFFSPAKVRVTGKLEKTAEITVI